jgi:hypothetical protein
LRAFDGPLAEQGSASSRSDPIDIVIARSRIRVEMLFSSALRNSIVEGLVEVFHGEWLAQLQLMIPFDRVGF